MPTADIKLEISGLDLSQYCGAWAMDESSFAAQLAVVKSLDMAAHVAANAGRNVATVSQSTAGTVALIDIVGTLTKRGSSLSSAGSLTQLRKAVRSAASDPEIGSILLRIDSPGGTVSGTADLAAEIAAANQRKPVYAFVEDTAASAAYWLASQATKVYANNETAVVGSIGTYFAVYDLSAAAEKEGIEAVVIRTSPLKGAGVPGDKITDEQKAVWQDLVDGAQEQFNAAVQSGRGMTAEQVAAVATGRVYRASEAQALGLIDGIKSFDETLAELTQVASQQKGRKPMAATFDEIKSACGGIDISAAEDSQFICDQLAKGVDAEAASKNWMETLSNRAKLAREAEANAKAEAEAAKAEQAKQKPAPGVDPLVEEKGGKSFDGSAKDEFTSRVESLVAKGMRRDKALSSVVSADPALHRAMIDEANGR